MIIFTSTMGTSNLKLILISSTWDYTTFHNFLSMFKKTIKKEIISMQCKKMQRSYADIAMWWCRAEPLSILIFKSWQVWALYVMRGLYSGWHGSFICRERIVQWMAWKFDVWGRDCTVDGVGASCVGKGLYSGWQGSLVCREWIVQWLARGLGV